MGKRSTICKSFTLDIENIKLLNTLKENYCINTSALVNKVLSVELPKILAKFKNNPYDIPN